MQPIPELLAQAEQRHKAAVTAIDADFAMLDVPVSLLNKTAGELIAAPRTSIQTPVQASKAIQRLHRKTTQAAGNAVKNIDEAQTALMELETVLSYLEGDSPLSEALPSDLRGLAQGAKAAIATGAVLPSAIINPIRASLKAAQGEIATARKHHRQITSARKIASRNQTAKYLKRCAQATDIRNNQARFEAGAAGMERRVLELKTAHRRQYGSFSQ